MRLSPIRFCAFVALVSASVASTRLFALDVSTQQVLIEVKIAEVDSTVSQQLIERLPLTSKGREYDFLKFAGPMSQRDSNQLIGSSTQFTPVRTIDTTSGARSSVTTSGFQLSFVPKIRGDGTSIDIEIRPTTSELQAKPFHVNYPVALDQSVLLGIHPVKSATDLLVLVRPSFPTFRSSYATSPSTNPFTRFEISAGYQYMQTDGEAVKGLNGFTVAGYYNFNRNVAAGVQFGGYYGTQTSFGEEMFLDRYSLMAGARLQSGVDGPVRPFGQVLLGGVRDRIGVDVTGGYSSSTATAFGMSLGVGVNFEVGRHLTLTPSVDYFPTFFGGHRQDNWRLGLGAGWRF